MATIGEELNKLVADDSPIKNNLDSMGNVHGVAMPTDFCERLAIISKGISQILFSVLALVLLPQPVFASTTFYTDSSSWNAGVVGAQTDNFTQNQWATNGTYLGTAAISGGTIFSVPYDSGQYGNGNFSRMWGFPGKLTWSDYYNEILPLTISFASPTYAIGLNLGDLTGNKLTFVMILHLNDGSSSSCTPSLFGGVGSCGDRVIVAGTANGYSFAGATSTTPFSSVTIAATQGAGEAFTSPTPGVHYVSGGYPTLSSLTVASLPPVAAVPLPQTWMMLFSGLLAMTTFVRRKRSGMSGA